MKTARLFYTCVVRSRCPCCGEGPLFQGWLRFLERCPACGLVYDQWVGEWITPTYLASSIGMLVAVGLIAAVLATGFGLDGPLPPELGVFALSAGVALAALRPSKAFWLAFLYGVGGVEVSAETRALLRWTAAEEGDPAREQRARDAEARARSQGAHAPSAPVHVQRRIASWRSLLFPNVALQRQRKPDREREPEYEQRSR